ncbi:MAG: DUF1735 domain-containing protein [Muribaculaceae bacterium]
MKRNIFKLLTAILIIFVSACQSDRMNEMADDQIYLLHPGLVSVDTYTGDDTPFQLYVIKSGMGQQGVRATIEVDETVLEGYNKKNGTAYTLLPNDCYSLMVKELSFGDKDYRKSFDVQWNNEKIAALQATSTNIYVLPLQMKVIGGVKVSDPEKLSAIVSPIVKEPSLGMLNSGLYLPGMTVAIKDIDEFELYSKVKTNYNNKVDLTYTLEIDPQILKDYNTAHKTNYQMLPDGACELSQTSWKIPANNNESTFKFLFHKKLLIPDANTFLFGDYVVPIRITSVSKFGISKDAATYLYPISFQPNELRKDAWTVIDYNNCVTQDETWLNTLPWQPDKLIDNDLKTFWGSKWTTPGPMPYYFIIDLGEVYKLFKMGFDNPIGAESWRGNAKAGTVEVSMDNKQWEPLVSWTAPNIQERSVRFGFPPKEARYIKFSVTEAFNMYQKGAQMNIAEIYAWGQ